MTETATETTTETPERRDLIPVIVERENAVLPEGFDSWGIKSTRLDLTTRNDYRWPFPGQVATCDPEQLVKENDGACPSQPGDGLCVATSYRGMASGGFPAITMLLVAYKSAEVLGRDECDGKLRTAEVAVVALVDGARLLRECGEKANLSYANLRGADLRGADLDKAIGVQK